MFLNNVRQFTAQLDDRRILIPMNLDNDGFPEPIVQRTYATDSYTFDGGSPASNSSWQDGMGLVRGDLHIAWSVYDEGGYVMLGRGDAGEFMAKIGAAGFFAEPEEGGLD
ncbi:hypothetical protein [Nonomuraea glycinis]|uniref:hypothetical protein n=1 Tax=Nonomuraea glycinis TaxID=2047744 RepID=UPI0033BF8153